MDDEGLLNAGHRVVIRARELGRWLEAGREQVARTVTPELRQAGGLEDHVVLDGSRGVRRWTAPSCRWCGRNERAAGGTDGALAVPARLTAESAADYRASALALLARFPEACMNIGGDDALPVPLPDPQHRRSRRPAQ
ncbi:hypothetical protein AB0B15_42465 [Streptomyces sp. NPDC045456]|uniref:hypothetical protein n=1 Tax=Streptomyces sp. NPDC045456 TaxID=3155254 RepID=UPI0033F64E95